MNSMKAIPILLLTLAVYNPCAHAVPALNPPRSPNPGDGDAGPALDPPGSPTVTPFFIPAVLLPDYYTRPAPTAMAVVPEDDAASPGSQPAPASNPEVAAEPVTDPENVALLESSSSTSLMDSPATVTTPAAEPTATLSSDAVDITPAPELASPTSSSAEDIPLIFTISSEAVTFSVPASQLSSISPGTVSHHSLNPTHSAVSQPPDDTKVSESSSPETQMSRKTAIIGTILAVASLLGISVCAFCMRCRVPRHIRGSPNAADTEALDPDNKDPEKALADKKSTSPVSSQQSSMTLPLPTLTCDAPNGNSQSAQQQENDQLNGQQRPTWKHNFASSVDNDDFEDVTHILSNDAFAPLSGSERSSAASDISNTSMIVHRVSGGAPSVKAESYATCESRYSNVSGVSNVESQAVSSDTAASSEYLSMSPAGTPSPPDSPILRTPKQCVATVTRSRSKTLTQPTSPRVTSTMSISKSFPARCSDRMSDLVARVDEEGSEWDIAAAYGARFSKGSVGVRSTISEMPEEHRQEHEYEHIETIDIGGRSVIMVTGYAF